MPKYKLDKESGSPFIGIFAKMDEIAEKHPSATNTIAALNSIKAEILPLAKNEAVLKMDRLNDHIDSILLGLKCLDIDLSALDKLVAREKNQEIPGAVSEVKEDSKILNDRVSSFKEDASRAIGVAEGPSFWRKYAPGWAKKVVRPRWAKRRDAALEAGDLYYKNKDYKSASEEYTKAIVEDPTNPYSYAKRAQAYHANGYAYHANGYSFNFKATIKDYETAISLGLKTKEAYFELGDSYEKFGYLDKAITAFNNAEKLGMASSLLYYTRGNAYLEFGKPTEAIADFSKAEEKGMVNKCLLYYGRGQAYCGLGQHEKAIADFTKAKSMGMTEPELNKFHGYAYLALGKYNEAAADLGGDFKAGLEAHAKGKYKDAVAAYEKFSSYIQGDNIALSVDGEDIALQALLDSAKAKKKPSVVVNIEEKKEENEAGQKKGEESKPQEKPKKSDYGFWYSPEVKSGTLDEQLLAYAKSMDEKSGGFSGITVTDAKAKKYLDEAKSLMEEHGLLDANSETIGMTKEQVLILLTLMPLVMRGKEQVDKFFSKIEGKDVLGVANYIYDEKTGKSQFALENVSAKSQKLYADLSATNFKRAESMATSQQPVINKEESSSTELATLANDAKFIVANSVLNLVDMGAATPDLKPIGGYNNAEGGYDTDQMLRDAGAKVVPIEAPALTSDESAAIKSYNAAMGILEMAEVGSKSVEAAKQKFKGRSDLDFTIKVDAAGLKSSLAEMGLLDTEGAITKAGADYLAEIGIDKPRKQKAVLAAINEGRVTDEAVRYMVARKLQDDLVMLKILGKNNADDPQDQTITGLFQLNDDMPEFAKAFLKDLNSTFFERILDACSKEKAKEFTEKDFLSLGLSRESNDGPYTYAGWIADTVSKIEASPQIKAFATPLEAIAYEYANGRTEFLDALVSLHADPAVNSNSLAMPEFIATFSELANNPTQGEQVTAKNVGQLLTLFSMPAQEKSAGSDASSITQPAKEQPPGGVQAVEFTTGVAWLDNAYKASNEAQGLFNSLDAPMQEQVFNHIKQRANSYKEQNIVDIIQAVIDIYSQGQ